MGFAVDWISLQKKYEQSLRPQPLSERSKRLLSLQAVIDGNIYDCIENDFGDSNSDGYSESDYIKLSDRRPSVKTCLISQVCDDLASMLFGEHHFPTANTPDVKTANAIVDFVNCVNVQTVFTEAARTIMKGSAAILFEISGSRPYIENLDTAFCEPTFSSPSGVLVEVVERVPVYGSDIPNIGPMHKNAKLVYIVERKWTTTETISYLPYLAVPEKNKPVEKHVASAVNHSLGFVPIVWMKSLSSEKYTPDGRCTFKSAIDTMIECDYLLSQGGRALKYTSDPTLVIKQGNEDDGFDDMDFGDENPNGARKSAAHVGGSSKALSVPKGGDAKLLEINGHGSHTIIEYTDKLANIAMATMQGPRGDVAQFKELRSAKGVERTDERFLRLCGRMQTIMGEGLLDLYEMFCITANIVRVESKNQLGRKNRPMRGLYVGTKRVYGLDAHGIKLKWPPFFSVTSHELLEYAQALGQAESTRLISHETAVEIFATKSGVSDPKREYERILKELKDKDGVLAAPQTNMEGKV